MTTVAPNMEIAVTPLTGSVNRATMHLVVIDYGTQHRVISGWR